MHTSQKDLEKIKNKILDFRKKRDWEKFHDPKNLAEAISIEAGELLEIFLWKKVEDSRKIDKNDIKKVGEEISDIFIFMIYLCEEFKIDLFEQVIRKIEINKKKYPINRAIL